MSLSRRRFTQEFKLSAVERLEQGTSAAEVSRAYEVNPNLLHRWRREFRQGPGNAFPGEGKRRWEETRTAELERKVGRQTMEIDFLKGVLAAHRTTAEAAGIGWKAAVSHQIRQQVQEKPPMSVQRMCQLASLPRASFYRWQPEKQGGPIRTWNCVTPSSASRWSSPATAGHASPPSCAAAAG